LNYIAEWTVCLISLNRWVSAGDQDQQSALL